MKNERSASAVHLAFWRDVPRSDRVVSPPPTERSSMMGHAVIRPILALALVVAACGGGDEDVLGMGDRGLDRCSLITATEAEQWLGATVKEPAPAEGISGDPDPVTCRYENEQAIMLVQVYDGPEFHAEVGSPVRTGETVDGLGEDAWIGDGGIHFLQNEWSVSAATIAGQISDEALLEIGQLMSSRLP